jgi:hypothetical protein
MNIKIQHGLRRLDARILELRLRLRALENERDELEALAESTDAVSTSIIRLKSLAA